jgi:hypothetical protein
MRALGRVISATSEDGLYSAVIGLCRRCALDDRKLPEQLRGRPHAIERALSDPSKYLCTVYADPGAAQLALALLRHKEFSARALAALGWLGDQLIVQAEKSEAPKRLQQFAVG